MTMELGYKMGDTVLGTTIQEKDARVTIVADMNISKQCIGLQLQLSTDRRTITS